MLRNTWHIWFMLACAAGILYIVWGHRSHEPAMQPTYRTYITRFPPCNDETMRDVIRGIASPVWEGDKCYIVPLSAGGMK